jgi:ketosteroid isomerase-like protein
MRLEEAIEMTIRTDSPAVDAARAHVEAWSTGAFDAAREALADDITVTVESTSEVLPRTELAGIDAYMKGLEEFARGVVPGSLVVHASLGDDHNALLLTSVTAAFGPDGPAMKLPAARLYLLDEDGRIKAERVVVFVAPA